MKTKMFIKCKIHGKQIAIATIGGEIYCKKCQQKVIKNEKKH